MNVHRKHLSFFLHITESPDPISILLTRNLLFLCGVQCTGQKQSLFGRKPSGDRQIKSAWWTESDSEKEGLRIQKSYYQRKPTSGFCGLFPADRIGRLVESYSFYSLIWRFWKLKGKTSWAKILCCLTDLFESLNFANLFYFLLLSSEKALSSSLDKTI